MERIRKRLGELKNKLRELYRARDEAATRGHALRQEEVADFQKYNEALNRELRTRLPQMEEAAKEDRKRADEKRKRRGAVAEAAYARRKAQIEREAAVKVAACEDARRQAYEKDTAEFEKKVTAHGRRCEDELKRAGTLRERAAELRGELAAYARNHGIKLDSANVAEAEPEEKRQSFEDLEARLAEIARQFQPDGRKAARRLSPFLVYAFFLLIHAGAAYWGVHAQWAKLQFALIPVSLFIVYSIVYILFYHVKERAWARVVGPWQSLREWDLRLEVLRRQVDSRHEDERRELINEKIDRNCQTDEKFRPAMEEAMSLDLLQKLRDRREALLKKIESRRQAEIARLEAAHAARIAELRSKSRTEAEERAGRHAARLNEIETEKTTAIERLAAAWAEELTDFRAFARAELRRDEQARLAWDRPPAKEWRLPESFATEVPVGEVRLNLTELELPCDPEGPFSLPGDAPFLLPARLAFPINGGLYARAGTGKREDAMRMLFNAALRLFCSFPPGKTKMTIVDPVGLGQNFAALMHLADFDESLVGGRIWSDVTHIERELTELTEHMEIIIQKYLRNRFASLDEYNREAGQMAEPYRFLLIADFPTGFSELAMEKLAGILASGSRCGVYALIHQDQRQKTPVILNEAHLKRNGLFFFEQDGAFFLDEPVMNNRGRFVAEEPPQAAVVDEILRAVGAQSRDAVRVEVPFEAAAPRPEQVWSMTTDQVVRLPLGKSGAERLQYMELGRGTSQHALIAGKTGSGKSTLFHVIITNAALWYAPRELEVYLIDFKKGVEFKIYAEHQLPHARVVAIESDREFGLSVLRRIDKELTRRGELFRNVRVQDLAAYRKSGAAEVLPRTLLMIDEFQEFFTEDDGISGDAALLLDRIVRQGRAFGVHVILGSQTLGGTYTLAKSTLGQMAVRIALQCNEADSYLILSDDNAAARLLSRPGEGIYNDMAGLIEGNNPFQVVWLAKETQSAYLEMARRKALEKPSPLEPTIVFEGNVPADLHDNKPLFALAEQAPEAEISTCAWLGEANAIKGPTEVQFTSNSGGNLLIVGQRGEAASGMAGTMILSLAAGAPPEQARFYVLDGTAPEYGTKELWAALTAALPHAIEVIDQRQVAPKLAELAAKVKARREGDEADQGRDYLLVLGLHKFRMLRQDDEFGFSSGDDDASPARCLADLLNEGPGFGVHALVWCDTLGNLNRSFGRKTMREFESRVLFQMAAADSTELIDSPAANLLGLYNALLFTVQDGSVEKFRQYAMPDKELIQKLGDRIRKKYEK